MLQKLQQSGTATTTRFMTTDQANQKAATRLKAITVGGVPRSQGGKLLGYGVPGEYIIYPSFPSVICAWPWAPSIPRVKISQEGEFRCTGCKTYNRVEGRGTKTVPEREEKCWNCNKKHLIFRDAVPLSSLPSAVIDIYGEFTCSHCWRDTRVADSGYSSVEEKRAACRKCGAEYRVFRNDESTPEKIEIDEDGYFRCQSCGEWNRAAQSGHSFVEEREENCLDCRKKYLVSRGIPPVAAVEVENSDGLGTELEKAQITRYGNFTCQACGFLNKGVAPEGSSEVPEKEEECSDCGEKHLVFRPPLLSSLPVAQIDCFGEFECVDSRCLNETKVAEGGSSAIKKQAKQCDSCGKWHAVYR